MKLVFDRKLQESAVIPVRIPKIPPSYDRFSEFAANPERAFKVINAVESPCVNGAYPHWDKLRYMPPPDDLKNDEWWFALKFRRRSLYRELPFWDTHGNNFVFLLADPMTEVLHQIDLGAGGLIQVPGQITNPDTRDQYYISSLIDEAITSSQIEGASTTRIVAKEMIRSGRQPRDRSERMILNNYVAMKELGTLKNQPLTKELVFEIHRLVTEGTLDDPTGANRFRRDDENIMVVSSEGQVLHQPPLASNLERRMEAMCDFANGETPDSFIHPALRSIILHFWLSYDHPFVDGNGRTARALFYWSMLRHKYWLFEFISISRIIRKGLVKYGRAFLLTETDDNDLTYFIRYHLRVIKRAIESLHEYIKRKSDQFRKLEAELKGIGVLNHRQRALISHALRHPRHQYTFESHRMSHNVVYQTSRTDLLDLQERGLLSGNKIAKTWYFTPVSDLEERLTKLAPA